MSVYPSSNPILPAPVKIIMNCLPKSRKQAITCQRGSFANAGKNEQLSQNIRQMWDCAMYRWPVNISYRLACKHIGPGGLRAPLMVAVASIAWVFSTDLAVGCALPLFHMAIWAFKGSFIEEKT